MEPQDNQLSMFDAVPPRFPRARTTDAASSHEAAALMELDGAARKQARRVLDALRRHPNSTSRELAKASRIDRYAVGRRLPELAELGLVERIEVTDATVACAIAKRRALRWRPR